MKPIRALIVVLSFSCLFITTARAADPVLTIIADKVAAHVSPTLYGLMTEEINYSYDGGLYGELIRNRVFKGSETPRAGRAAQPVFTDANKLAHWSVVKYTGADGTMFLDTTQPLNAQLEN